jgi:small subunit ribosomal protein S8
MVTSDPIADMLNRIKIARQTRKDSLVVPFSNKKMAITELLQKEGYIGQVTKKGKKAKKTIVIAFNVEDKELKKINSIKRISKPSRRVYKGVKEIRPVKYGKGLLVLSTPNGLLTDKEARAAKVGGEAMFEIF